MKNLVFATALFAAVPAAAVEIPAHYPTAANAMITSSAAGITTSQIAAVLGAPNNSGPSLGSEWIQYDFGNFRLVDGPGADFNVYHVIFFSAYWESVNVLVSADGSNFFNMGLLDTPTLDLIGDDASTNINFRRSGNLGAAATALGATQFRYLRIDGNNRLQPGLGSVGFILDAVGLANFTELPSAAVPEPASWAMLIAGFGLVGAAMRRRVAAVAG